MKETQEHKVGNDIESFAPVLPVTSVVIKYSQNKLPTAYEHTRLLKKFDCSNDKAMLFNVNIVPIKDFRVYQEPFSTILEDIRFRHIFLHTSTFICLSANI